MRSLIAYGPCVPLYVGACAIFAALILGLFVVHTAIALGEAVGVTVGNHAALAWNAFLGYERDTRNIFFGDK